MNVSSTASSRMLSRLVLALVALVMLGAGCSQQKVPPSLREVDKQALETDSLYMARLYAKWDQAARAQGAGFAGERGRMSIDLADDTQYRFLKNRLLAAGSTPDNSPHLFRRIEKLRKERKDGIPDTMTRKDRLTASATGPKENPWCGHVLPLNDAQDADSQVAKFEATGLVTCFNGADYTYVDVTAFATDAASTRFRVLDTRAEEQYAGATVETQPLDLKLKVGEDELLVVDSLSLAFNETTGESHLSYTVAESSIVALGVHGEPGINTMYFEHPTELIGAFQPDNAIRTCLERGATVGYLDCDYTTGRRDAATGAFLPFGKPFTGISAVDNETTKPPYGSWLPKRGAYWEPANGVYEPTHLYVAMRGTHQTTLPTNLCTIDERDSDVSVFLLERGGRCTAGKDIGTKVLNGGLPFKPHSWHDYYPRTLVLPFDGLADFGTDCLDHMQNVRLVVRSTVKATCLQIGMTTAGQRVIRTSTKEIFNLDFRNACLAEGTKVTKADGSLVAVEHVKQGDKLLTNGKGVALTVTTVSRGGESKPMVKLRDDRGGEVLVTQTHPMVTAARGVVQAGELKVGESLLTRTGTAKLVGVERVPYTGQVFNFALGTPEELASVGPEARTLYANGYLVGDSSMQSRLEQQRKVDARSVLAKLNGAWHEDYRRHQARQARR
ncbi:Hint domain-containing protein [Archangium lipolyticum]|uniref:Hint domain-containing protein n=1 Tax=Archangium lipolyticum TaxID=2970465 RepID=UPI002149C1DE|nr:Hint domain-containing protein [Archangium lipolyticum]